MHRVLQMLQVNNKIWCLVELVKGDEENEFVYQWKSFDKMEDVHDYIRKVDGEPITLPPMSLTPSQAEIVVCVV